MKIPIDKNEIEDFEKEKLLSYLKDLEQKIIDGDAYNITIRVKPNYHEYTTFGQFYPNFLLVDKDINIGFTLKE